MMESPPASPLEMGEAELALQFLIVALDPPAQLDGVDESRERGVLRQGREEVFGRLRLALRPFDDEPFDGMGLDEPVIARRRPHPHGGEARGQGLIGAFAPRDVRPGLGGQAHRVLEREAAGYDLASYRDAPAGLRIWGGATVETSDVEALLPWLDWAYAQQCAAMTA